MKVEFGDCIHAHRALRWCSGSLPSKIKSFFWSISEAFLRNTLDRSRCWIWVPRKGKSKMVIENWMICHWLWNFTAMIHSITVDLPTSSSWRWWGWALPSDIAPQPLHIRQLHWLRQKSIGAFGEASGENSYTHYQFHIDSDSVVHGLEIDRQGSSITAVHGKQEASTMGGIYNVWNHLLIRWLSFSEDIKTTGISFNAEDFAWKCSGVCDDLWQSFVNSVINWHQCNKLQSSGLV